jgi:hypothetical protein
MPATGEAAEVWSPTGTSKDGCWEWSHTVDEVLMSSCVSWDLEGKVTVAVIQNGP